MTKKHIKGNAGYHLHIEEDPDGSVRLVGLRPSDEKRVVFFHIQADALEGDRPLHGLRIGKLQGDIEE